jgi:hypothetical protein
MRRLLRAVVAAAGVTLSILGSTPLIAHAETTSSTRGQISVGSDVKAASGDFTAAIDVRTIQLQPVGSRCLLRVDGALTFRGSLEGTATGTTSALEDATCAQVQANPPGTFGDVFRFTGQFSGSVDGRTVQASLVYAGRTAPGGSIDAVMLLTGGVTAVLQVSARVAVGGTYSGLLVLP